MARCTIQPGSALQGSIRPPPSYAHAIRLIWGACLGTGGAIGNVPERPAIRALLEAGRQMGADPVLENNVADIFGPGSPYPVEKLSCQDNIYASRLALPLACFFGKSATLTDVLLPAPPSRWLSDAAQSLGVRITNTSSQITVSGPPNADAISLTDREGAFWAPGFLMAIPLSSQELVIQMDDFVRSHPAVTLTLATLDQFGIAYSQQNDETTSLLTIPPMQRYPARYIDVEGDWRTGSYLLAALLMCGKGEVALSFFSAQPERQFWKMLEEKGLLSFSEDGLVARPQGHRSLDWPDTLDPRPCPALLPLFMVLATQSARAARIGPLTPVSPRTLARAKAMETALNLLGASVSVSENYIDIVPSKLSGGSVDCDNDARVAMALGLAGLIASGPVVIENAQAVSTVHAGFWADLSRLGARSQLTYEKSAPPPPAKSDKNSVSKTRYFVPPTRSPPARAPPADTPPGPIQPIHSVDDDWHSL